MRAGHGRCPASARAAAHRQRMSDTLHPFAARLLEAAAADPELAAALYRAPVKRRVPVAERLVQLAAFHAEHDRWPSSGAQDPVERVLGQWLNRQRTSDRTGVGAFTSDRGEIMDGAVPGWRGPQRPWSEHLTEIVAFRAEHGHWPMQSSAEAGERYLALWQNRQRMTSKRGTLPEDRRDALDAVAPGWRILRETWETKADRLAAWHQANGNWPSSIATDPDERKLGRWLNQQRTAERKGTTWFTLERATYLSGKVRGWRG